MRIPAGKGIAGWVALHGKPLLIKDVKKDKRFYSTADKNTNFVTKSILCVPLTSKEKTIGIVEVINKNKKNEVPRNFTDNDLTLLTALANQSAVALENAMLYEKISKEKERIETIVNSMTDPVIVTDEKFDVTLINPAAKSLFPNIFEKNTEINHKNAIYYNQRLSIILNEIRDFCKNSNYDIVLMKPEGIILNNNVTIMKNKNNEFQGSILALRNITALKERERSTIEFIAMTANNMAEKQKKLYKYLRELKIITPENSINNIPCSSDIKNNLLEIYLGILKFLYYTELESGPLRLDRTNINLNEVIDSIIEITQYGINKRSVILETEISGDLNKIVNIDKDQIKHILERLILNSAETIDLNSDFNDTPAVKLIVQEKLHFFEIIITDPGYNGLNYKESEWNEKKQTNSETQDHFFYRNQLDKIKLARSPLENSYLKHIIDAHGGNFGFNNKNNKYSYYFSLPKNWWS
jgi:signal transduction histidine kinase